MATELITLDEDTAQWLMDMSKEAGVPPWVLAAAILRDVRVDDEEAHQTIN